MSLSRPSETGAPPSRNNSQSGEGTTLNSPRSPAQAPNGPSSPAAGDKGDTPSQPKGLQFWLVIVSLMVATFVSALDVVCFLQCIVSLAENKLRAMFIPM